LCASFSYVLLRLNRRLQTESTAPNNGLTSNNVYAFTVSTTIDGEISLLGPILAAAFISPQIMAGTGLR
ncbi:MAG: hypothetical protein MZV64_53010, partial [Ignavibacteriales bacterium]|nr:hypothetical protein [Ignavibacteriales bacterium]